MSPLKILIGAQLGMLLIFGSATKLMYDVAVESSCKAHIVDVAPKAKAVPKYKPSEHNSETQHKFEASVKRTE